MTDEEEVWTAFHNAIALQTAVRAGDIEWAANRLIELEYDELVGTAMALTHACVQLGGMVTLPAGATVDDLLKTVAELALRKRLEGDSDSTE